MSDTVLIVERSDEFLEEVYIADKICECWQGNSDVTCRE